jgi:GNAT superfamily N-acetyltransferase
MPEPASDLLTAPAAAVIEATLNATLLSFARLPGATLHGGPACSWIDAGVPDATFNAVVAARFRPEAVDAQIEAVLAHFRRCGRPVTWHLGPSTTPADLGDRLLEHGLVHEEDEPGMALALGRVAAPPAPAGLAIEEVRDARGLADWVAVWLFPVPPSGRRRALAVLRRQELRAGLPWRYYLGRLAGVPVATAALFTTAEAAAVHHVVTLPAARRRGIGTAMTARVLGEARAYGCRLGVLTASPDGLGLYRRLGFRAYCQVRRYVWVRATQPSVSAGGELVQDPVEGHVGGVGRRAVRPREAGDLR